MFNILFISMHYITAISYSKNYIACSFEPKNEDNDNNIIIFSTKDINNIERQLIGHHEWVRCIKFSNNTKLIASCSNDKSIIVWCCSSWKSLYLTLAHSGPVMSLCFTDNDHIISCSTKTTSLIKWNFRNNNITSSVNIDNGMISLCISNDSKYIVSGSVNNKVILWDSNLNIIKQLVAHKDSVLCVVISHDNKYLGSSSYDSELIIWELINESNFDFKIKHVFNNNSLLNLTTSLCFSYNNRIIAIGSFNNISLFDIEEGKLKYNKKEDGLVKLIKFNRLNDNYISYACKEFHINQKI